MALGIPLGINKNISKEFMQEFTLQELTLGGNTHIHSVLKLTYPRILLTSCLTFFRRKLFLHLSKVLIVCGSVA